MSELVILHHDQGDSDELRQNLLRPFRIEGRIEGPPISGLSGDFGPFEGPLGSLFVALLQELVLMGIFIRAFTIPEIPSSERPSVEGFRIGEVDFDRLWKGFC